MEKKKIIQGYRVNLSLEKMGYKYYKLNMTLNNFDKSNEFLNFSASHKNIIYLDRTLSDLDFELDVEVQGKQELLSLIKEIKTIFSIRDIEIISFEDYYKIELLPS